MNKPDWNDAPEWANYLAMDASGEWYWYASKPEWNENTGTWWSTGRFENANWNRGNNPDTSFEERPQ